jgi:hypothetical protein
MIRIYTLRNIACMADKFFFVIVLVVDEIGKLMRSPCPAIEPKGSMPKLKG